VRASIDVGPALSVENGKVRLVSLGSAKGGQGWRGYQELLSRRCSVL